MTKQEIINQIESRIAYDNHAELINSLLSLGQQNLEWVKDVILQVNKNNSPGNYLTAIIIQNDRIDLRFGSGIILFTK